MSPAEESRRPVRAGPAGVLLYDGDCEFCRVWVRHWHAVMSPAIEFQPYQQAAARFPELEAAACARAVHLVEPDGRVERGAAAVLRALELGAGRRRWMRAYRRWRWCARLAEIGYASVARRRRLFSWLMRRIGAGEKKDRAGNGAAFG